MKNKFYGLKTTNYRTHNKSIRTAEYITIITETTTTIAYFILSII